MEIVERLTELAKKYFNTLDISTGSYTASQVVDWIGSVRNDNAEQVSVNVGTFSCSMPKNYLFTALHEFERLAGVQQKKKARFIRMDKPEEKPLYSVTIKVDKNARDLVRVACDDFVREKLCHIYVDLKNQAAVASDGYLLVEYPIGIVEECGNREDYPEDGVLIDKHAWDKVTGKTGNIRMDIYASCDESSAYRLIVYDEEGHVHECNVAKGHYPNYRRVYPKLNRDGYIRVAKGDIKGIMSLMKSAAKNKKLSNSGVDLLIQANGRTANFSYCDDLGKLNSLDVRLDSSPICDVVLRIRASHFLKVKHWNGGIWYLNPYTPFVIDDLHATLALMPALESKREYEYSKSSVIGKISVYERHGMQKQPIKPEEERVSIIIMENDKTAGYRPGARYAIEDLAKGNYMVKEGENNPELKRIIQSMAHYALGKSELQIKIVERFRKEYGDARSNPDFHRMMPLPEKEIARMFMEVYQAEGIEGVPGYPVAGNIEQETKLVPMPAREPNPEIKAEIKTAVNEREIIPILELETTDGILIVAGENYLEKLYDINRGEFFSQEAEARFNEIDAFISDKLMMARPLDLEAIGEAVEAFMIEVEKAG